VANDVSERLRAARIVNVHQSAWNFLGSESIQPDRPTNMSVIDTHMSYRTKAQNTGPGSENPRS